MGHPWHQIRHLEDEAGLIALSANFELYGDMSDRMMSLAAGRGPRAAGLGPEQEIYSIDESFVGLHGMRGDLAARARAVPDRPTALGPGQPARQRPVAGRNRGAGSPAGGAVLVGGAVGRAHLADDADDAGERPR
jgi:hypothetical protein